jgi:hypothetical protein
MGDVVKFKKYAKAKAKPVALEVPDARDEEVRVVIAVEYPETGWEESRYDRFAHGVNRFFSSLFFWTCILICILIW